MTVKKKKKDRAAKQKAAKRQIWVYHLPKGGKENQAEQQHFPN